MDIEPSRNPSTDIIFADVSYLRKRVDAIFDEVHKAKKTDWTAIGTISGVLLILGGAFGSIAMGLINTQIDEQRKRIDKLEVRADSFQDSLHDKMQKVATDTVNELVRTTNDKWYRKQ